jgi:FtsH-binding integral membrane protein
MPPLASCLNPTSRRLFVALMGAFLLLAVTLSSGVAQVTAEPGGPATSSPAVAVSTSPAIASTPVTTDARETPDEDDVVLVLGYTAVTVLGLAGLALLDRKPEAVDPE